MLKEREFRAETVDRPVDNRYGAGYANRSDYGYVEEPRYDAYMRSYDDRAYGDAGFEQNAYYDVAEREYPREDYVAPGQRFENPVQADPYVGFERQNFGYRDYNASTNAYDFNSGFAAPQATTFEHVEYQTKKNGKRTLNANSKMLIAVYFVLVAVIASLIIANVVAFGGGSVEAQAPSEATYNQEAVNMAVTADGNVVEMGEVRQLENYRYEKNTNWFDSFCDWVVNISK